MVTEPPPDRRARGGQVEAAARQRLEQAGLRTLAYTVNEAADVARLQAWGVDGIITDAVDRFSPA